MKRKSVVFLGDTLKSRNPVAAAASRIGLKAGPNLISRKKHRVQGKQLLKKELRNLV